MTIRELIAQLEDMDDDVKDATVCVRVVKQWNHVETTVEGEITKVPEDFDVGLNRFTLEATSKFGLSWYVRSY